MKIADSPDIFQQKINDLFHGFEFICTCIDDILILTKGYWTDHVQKLKLNLNKLNEKGLQCNIEKSFFRHNEIEYSGFWVTHNGVKPIAKQKQAIKI